MCPYLSVFVSVIMMIPYHSSILTSLVTNIIPLSIAIFQSDLVYTPPEFTIGSPIYNGLSVTSSMTSKD